MADVFISYSREDRARADQVARGLQEMGLDVFWDNEIPPGHTWADYIEDKLTNCPVVIVLWSQHSVKSQWVREEARMGREKARLIPVLLDGTPAPFGFGEVQAADLGAWDGSTSHPDWVRFSQAAYNRARNAPPPPPRPQAPPAPPPAAPNYAYAPPPPPAAPNYAYASQAQSTPYAGGATHAAPAMSPFDYIGKCFRLYFNGKGRARRAEYWWWALFAFTVGLVATILDMSFGTNAYTGQPNSQAINTLSSLALAAPGISVQARRFHDIGASGWWTAALYAGVVIGYALIFAAMPSGNAGVAGVGVLFFLAALVATVVVGVIPGQKAENRYGPDPKAPDLAATFT